MPSMGELRSSSPTGSPRFAGQGIYVLHEGKVVEEETHEELIALDGHYAELYHLQSKVHMGGARQGQRQ